MARPMYVKVSDIQKDDDQYRIYNIPPNTRYVVSGCAGSGKSSLALLFLERALQDGEDENVPNQVYYIATVHELIECVRKQFVRFVTVPKYNDYAITGAAWSAGAISDLQRRGQNTNGPFLIRGRRCMEGTPHGYNNNWIDLRINKTPDYLLIDEAQDFDLNTLKKFYDAARKGCVFYGDDAQKIIANGTDLNQLCNALGIERYYLKRNWRLSKAIALFAQELPGQNTDDDLVRRCRGEYNEKPIIYGCDDENAMQRYILERCKKATVDDDIGIILRSNRQIHEWYQFFTKNLPKGKVSARYSYDEPTPFGLSKSYYDYLRETPVKILRYEDAKGQQFRDVYVIADDALMNDPKGMNCFYVGVTRAERYLYVLYQGKKPVFLANVDPDVYRTSDVQEINF
jgi:DNA helicase IV